MKFLVLLITFLFAWSTHAQTSNAEKIRNIKEIKRFAFGSCSNATTPQPMWKDMLKQKPDLWIWGGDIIYAEIKTPKDISPIKKNYDIQNQVKDYVDFKAQTPILGIWDDHDYSHNNANGKIRYKKESQKFLLDFLEEPADSPRRKQEGIYAAYRFGEGDKKIAVILIDNRYFLGLERQYRLLGSKQWEWFENVIKSFDAKLYLIVSGLSIYSPLTPFSEEWRDFRHDYNRMMRNVSFDKKLPVLFLTGDKHFSTIIHKENTVEFLSSGFTHTIKDPVQRWFVKNHYPEHTFDHSYGLVDIEWTNDSRPVLTLQARNEKNESVLSQKFEWSKDEWLKK